MIIFEKITRFRVKYLRWFYGPIVDSVKNYKIKIYRKKQCNRLLLLNRNKLKVFYLGITEQPNLGDMAQYFCIKKWIEDNYPERQLVMFESQIITDKRFTKLFFENLVNKYTEKDIIIIQSGYCTQDLGGDHPLMHRLVCDNLPQAKILMMPQTIFFKNEENKRLCSYNHNKAVNMLFLARDFVSYQMAKEMFPSIRVLAFPDIVTSLIGAFDYSKTVRNGICICTRNDGEKFYLNEDIDSLSNRFSVEGVRVHRKDTQGKSSVKNIREKIDKFVFNEIESYSHYNVTITDRYHGTIFSLCAGTPVIILKTKDHKVTTGADWFKGIYDDYVYVAKDLNDAFYVYKHIISKKLNHLLMPYFKKEYYDKLKHIFENP